MATVALGGYFGFQNIGDELILLSHLERFRQSAASSRVIVLSVYPAQTTAEYGVEAVQRWNPFSCLNAFRQADSFILGGGGLLQESSGPWNHLYYLSLVLAAKLMGCRTELHAMGIDPIESPFNRWLSRWVLNSYCDSITVRDAGSRDVLIGLGIAQPVTIVPDPVSHLHVPKSTATSHRIAVALAGPETASAHGMQALLESLAKIYDCRVDLFVMFPAQDLAIAQLLKHACPVVDNIMSPASAKELLVALHPYSMVIASRFHALVLAASAGIPFVGCGSQVKVRSICESHGMPYIQNLDSTDPTKVLEVIQTKIPVRAFV